MAYKIEKGIELPAKANASELISALELMEVGDCLQVTVNDEIDERKNVLSKAYQWGKSRGRKFSIRQVQKGKHKDAYFLFRVEDPAPKKDEE